MPLYGGDVRTTDASKIVWDVFLLFTLNALNAIAAASAAADNTVNSSSADIFVTMFLMYTMTSNTD